MPFENLSLQLKADNWQRCLEKLLKEYNKLEVLPESLRPSLKAYIDLQRELAERRLKDLEAMGIKPMPPGTIY